MLGHTDNFPFNRVDKPSSQRRALNKGWISKVMQMQWQWQWASFSVDKTKIDFSPGRKEIAP